MVSVIAKNLRDRRTHKALTEIFEKADTSNDGKITIEEYLQLCGNYGIEVSPDDLKNVETIADTNGGISKSDFILYVKQADMFSMFDTVDPESDHHWNEKVKMAWKLFDKNGDGRLTQLEFRWMTDKKLLTNNKIKLMFSKCDIDGDGALDFEEFKEMILRNRQRKELAKLQAEEEEERLALERLGEIKQTASYLYTMEEIMEEDEEEVQEHREVETDEDIEEELDEFEAEMRKNDISEASDIPEEVSELQEDSNIEIAEEIDDDEDSSHSIPRGSDEFVEYFD